MLLACGSSKLFDLVSDLGSGRWVMGKGEGQSDWSDRACGSASREGWGASHARARGPDFFWKDNST